MSIQSKIFLRGISLVGARFWVSHCGVRFKYKVIPSTLCPNKVVIYKWLLQLHHRTHHRQRFPWLLRVTWCRRVSQPVQADSGLLAVAVADFQLWQWDKKWVSSGGMAANHTLYPVYSCRLFKELNTIVRKDIEDGRSAVGTQHSCRIKGSD